MESLESLLKYQKLDIELRKVLDEIERSEDNKKMEQARVEFNNAKNAVTETERAAEAIITFYNNAVAFVEEWSKKADDIAAQIEATDDIETQRALVAQLEKIREKLIDIEKKLAERTDKTDRIIKAYLDGQERGKKMRALFTAVKERLAEFKKTKEPTIERLRKELKAIEADIAPDVMQLYKTITAERKYPAFVAAIDAGDKKHYRCFCGLTLSQKAQSELLDKGCCRCENCRRLIYKA